MKSIYDLELHEILKIDSNYEVMRVHDGFIYTKTGMNGRQSSVFVPYKILKKVEIQGPTA